jgi:hypothetical protein
MAVFLLDLPCEVLTAVCQQLDLVDLISVAETCRCFRHGDGGQETAELPIKSPVLAALRALAFPSLELGRITRPAGCSETWVAYLARGERRSREAPPMAAGSEHSLFLTAGRLVTCGDGGRAGQVDVDPSDADGIHAYTYPDSSDECDIYSDPSPVAALVFTWGRNAHGILLGHPNVERALLPKPVQALRGVRVGSVATAGSRSYAVADTGEVWAWGFDDTSLGLGDGEQRHCLEPKPIEALRGIKADAVAAGHNHTLALADDGGVYVWGGTLAAARGALGLGSSVSDARRAVPTSQRIPALRVACGL